MFLESLTTLLVNVSLRGPPLSGWAGFVGDTMGIKSVFQDIVQRVHKDGLTDVKGRDRRRRDQSAVDEKISRAGLVADEWDGATALLARRGFTARGRRTPSKGSHMPVHHVDGSGFSK